MQTNTQPPQQQNQKMKSLMEDVLKADFSMAPKVGEVMSGTVIKKENATLYVDFGALGTGIIYGREFREALDIIRHMKPGDPISAKVVELENEKGFIELSLKEAGYTLAWDDLIAKMQKGEIVEVTIREANKGGLMADLNNMMAFLPVSQLSTKNYPRVDGGDKQKIYQELMKFVGTKFNVKVIDVNQQEGKLIISEKEAQDNDFKKLIEAFKVGDIVDGEVSGVVNFGAFIKFKTKDQEGQTIDLEGLAHISELDWQLIENPSDVVKVGDKVQAKIISLDGGKISLSLKALKKDPWENIEERFKKGDVVKGTVAKLNPFGIFVRLGGDIQGLCHISEFGNVEAMKQKVELGKTYDFIIQSISIKEHRMALGFGAVSKKTPRADKREKIEEKPAEESKAE
ncbi:hypothetical protein A3C91_04540 [Candidatus Azambacteria bacterium RIFCSPHIGHO2_02_FULL_52_12]|uniref:S1 motif domain-containing protein n=1 Tax=Candidatus Azambacteria bacterium RIFCSPLOWO2_01_FULL_46_25 TaxID=1797298 RepID=A0A1F5BV31_9BACT|nr:MAG: hypothetical protein A3C91_04540 [Candidatus Azambacteria bacterium RIFCSPHIGHO2_02_FULL_52_12]OGD34473.1 MAG: hypothetical protein A2988_03035 [Candidatus Azambacteria bacterium RIFCSPLOWO2_01_FULL_46_25]OGD37590.1 MAG: hypothetical protein A2850_03520 [Candidatus Azambacteria bacterium RIFCSPHIGHO2_01_FULL_51_74]